MFEHSSEAGLLEAMRAAQRCERAAIAERLLAAGELCRRRLSEIDAADRTNWCIDNWEAVAAEVGAELGVSRGRASSQMHYGLELIERFPRLAAVFAAGEIDFRVVIAIVFRTGLIKDPELVATMDDRLAGAAGDWNALSQKKLAELIDWWVRSLDPAAVRVARDKDDDRHLDVGPGTDGMADVWGSVHATDAAAFDQRLEALAATVCPDDPRTKAQRRADAVGALSAGASVLACGCGSEECTQERVDLPSPIVIHILAEAGAISGDSESAALLPGYGAVPASTVRGLASTARLRPLPGGKDLAIESRYQPSRALAEFVRCRDLTCRFPGCDRPAEQADIDHTVPWPQGPTHPSNLKLLCRPHHLVKTFYVGPNGWVDRQLPDATVVWTSPAGRSYVTKPGGALFFPQLGLPTSELVLPVAVERWPGRGLMMPTRRRTRAEERDSRIRWERGLNQARIDADPPPF